MLSILMPYVSYLRAMYGDNKGVTAIEYGLIAALIAVVIIAGVTAVGTDLNTLFGTKIAGSITNAGG